MFAYINEKRNHWVFFHPTDFDTVEANTGSGNELAFAVSIGLMMQKNNLNFCIAKTNFGYRIFAIEHLSSVSSDQKSDLAKNYYWHGFLLVDHSLFKIRDITEVSEKFQVLNATDFKTSASLTIEQAVIVISSQIYLSSQIDDDEAPKLYDSKTY
jgi:hypothetical protein